VVITDFESIGISQLLGARAQAALQSLRLWGRELYCIYPFL